MSSFVNSGDPQLFKYLYLDGGWRKLVFNKRPFFNMVPKGEASSAAATASGAIGPQTGIIWEWNYSDAVGTSMSHGAALSQQDNGVAGTQLLAQLSQFYAYIRFNGKDLRASRSNLVAFLQARRFRFDSKIEDFGQQVDLAMHRAGNGIIGTVSAVSTANKTLTLTGISIQQFKVGARLVSLSTFPTDGTAPTPGPGSALITKVQQTYSAGVMGVVLTMDNVAGFDATTNKYISQVGNALGFSALNTEGNLIGMANYVPVSSPSSSDNFLSSINRSNDEYRLSGVRITADGRKFSEAVAEANGVTTNMGGGVDIVLVNPMDMNRCSIELGAQAVQSNFQLGQSGYAALETGGPAGGKTRWVSDPNQTPGELRGLTLDTWKLYSMGSLPFVMDEDGLTIRKDAGADAWQIAIGGNPQLVCFEPGMNWVMTGF